MDKNEKVVDRRVVDAVLARMNDWFFTQYNRFYPMNVRLVARQYSGGLYVTSVTSMKGRFMEADDFHDLRIFLANTMALMEAFPFKGWTVKEPDMGDELWSNELACETKDAFTAWEKATSAAWEESFENDEG